MSRIMELTSTPKSLLFEDNEIQLKERQVDNSSNIRKSISKIRCFILELVWLNIVYLIISHVMAFYGIYLAFTSAKWATYIFAIFMHQFSALGITAGAHRLWAHRSYKAKWPLKILLMIMSSSLFEGHVIAWARDHRVHHKYSDTMADPYNASRGFFFSHIGWLFVRKHPAVKEEGKKVDVSDLYNCPILAFQKKYYVILLILCGYILPTLIPYFCWDESILNAFAIPVNLRIIAVLQGTFLVNSVAHIYGNKPYDRHIRPVNNLFVAIFASGEGWHNYHHTFPWDYKTAELPNYFGNSTNAFIDFFAWIGWAYDLKTVDPDVIKSRVRRTGDGSHELWGWGDKDATNEDTEGTIIYNRKTN